MRLADVCCSVSLAQSENKWIADKTSTRFRRSLHVLCWEAQEIQPKPDYCDKAVFHMRGKAVSHFSIICRCSWDRQSGPLCHLEKPRWFLEQPPLGKVLDRDVLCTICSVLLKFILMPMVMTNTCVHFQWSQGEGCWWNGSRFRDVFPPVLFNVRFGHFPHLQNEKVKQ